MSRQDIQSILEELESQFENGFEGYKADKVESACRTCMFMGQFSSPKEMNQILEGVKVKYPNGFKEDNTYEVANEFKSQLKKYLGEE